MTTQQPISDDRGIDAILIAIATALACDGLLWLSGAISAVASGNPGRTATRRPGSSRSRTSATPPTEFLQRRGTVYLLGTTAGASATAGLVTAFVEAGRRLAAGNRGTRLDPPLALILDEAANYPMPSLPALMSGGGGSGITTLVVLQALSQARDVWGRDKAAAIWDSAIVKIILGGGGNAEDLRDLSALIGNRQEQRTTVSYGGTNGRSYSSSVEEKPVLEPARIRTLPFGYGLLLLRTAAPIMMRLHPWTSRHDAADLRTAQADLQQRIQTTNTSQVW